MIDVSDESIVAMIFHLDNGNTLKITSKEFDIANLSETNNYIILARLDGSGSIGINYDHILYMEVHIKGENISEKEAN